VIPLSGKSPRNVSAKKMGKSILEKELREGRKAKPAKVFSQSRVKTSGDTSP
jgi:hypothetical protein